MYAKRDMSSAGLCRWMPCVKAFTIIELLVVIGIELFPKAVDGRDRLSGESFSVDEHDAVDQLLQLFAPIQLSPA